jgi:ATP-binding cassette subfamily B protein
MFDSEGLELSRGQSQKLALARAFLYGQGLIVLDEPSASMDAVTEKEIFESTLKLMEGRTAVVITHRLSNVVQCDRIVYLEGGKIVESGTHEELMKQGGRYRELFMLQAQRYLSKQ